MARQIRVDQIDDFFEELVVDLVAENITENTSSTISGIPLHHSAEICGVITSVQVASGDAVIAYRLCALQTH